MQWVGWYWQRRWMSYVVLPWPSGTGRADLGVLGAASARYPPLPSLIPQRRAGGTSQTGVAPARVRGRCWNPSLAASRRAEGDHHPRRGAGPGRIEDLHGTDGVERVDRRGRPVAEAGDDA